jgi:hypothetical protein
VLHFVDDDPGYLSWVAGHPEGYVVSAARRPSAAYLMLHRATCKTITRLQPRARTFTGPWSKLCGDRDELEAYARGLGGTTLACGHCLRSR